MSDDAECLRRYSEAADQRGFAAFVQRNVDLVYSAAYRQSHGDRQLAEDITQEVFVAAARKASVLSRHPVIPAWLFQTTRFAAIDAVRAKRRRLVREAAVSHDDEAHARAEPAPAEWDHVSPRIDELIASLGDGDREAVVLRFLSDRSFAEIGAQLGISENGARMRVERALEKLRAKLARRGVTSTAAALGALIAQQGVMAAPAGLGAAAAAAAIAAPPMGLAAGALAALRFMSTAKITAGVATVVALFGITAAVREYQVAASARNAEVAARADLAAALDRAKRSDDAARSAEKAKASAMGRLAAGAAAPGAAGHGQSGDGASGGGTASKSPFTALMGLMENPAFQSVQALSAKLRLDNQYGALFHNLGLTPDQIDKFKQLLVEKEMAGFDGMSAAKSHGIDADTDPQGFYTAVAVSVKSVDSQIGALLGNEGFQQFQTYQETVPARNTSTLLQQALSYSSAPLTPEQNDNLIQVLTQYGKPALPPSNPFAVLNGDLGMINLSPAGLAQAQSFLSAPQIAVLQQKLQEQNQMLVARSKMGH